MSAFLFVSACQFFDTRNVYIPTTLIQSCMRHTTTQPTNAGIDAKANGLVSDLEALECVRRADQSEYTDNIVRFACTDDVKYMRSDIMRVLAEHDADLTGGCLEGTFYSGGTGWSAILPEE